MVFGLILVLLTACGESKPKFTDNGNPGQIKAIFYYDENKNGTMDSNETGVPTRVSISQEVSCPPVNDPTFYETDADGVYVFTDLKPGKYCVVSDSRGLAMTIKLTPEVYVSSDQVTTVYFGRGEK
jgi:uncharacterized protein (DUF2141 family)